MARITYTKTVYNFKFTPPKEISEPEFIQYKRFIQLNPNKPLINEHRAEQSHDKLTGFVLVGIILLIIGLIGMFGFDSPQWWGVVATIISVLGILHPIINGGVYESSKNSVNNFQDDIKFYQNLKEMIKNSDSYSDFAREYRLKYGVRDFKY
jgi:hypothetical protein